MSALKKHYAIAVLIFLSGAAILVQGRFGFKKTRSNDVALPHDLSQSILEFASQQGSTQGAQRSSQDLLAIFARAGDCPVCLEESLWWTRLSEDPLARDLRIIVFLNGVFPSEVKSIQDSLGARIQVSIDTADIAGKIRKQMETPAKFLIRNDSIIAIDSANYYREEKDAWLEGILRLLIHQSNAEAWPLKASAATR